MDAFADYYYYYYYILLLPLLNCLSCMIEFDFKYTSSLTTTVDAWCISIDRTTYIHITTKLVIVTNIICVYNTKAVI